LAGNEFFSIGVIVNTHSLKGEVRILPHYLKFPLKKLKKIQVKHLGKIVDLQIEKIRMHKQFWLLKFQGLEKVDDVIKYKGEAVFIEQAKAPRIAKDHYYWEEIIGCSLINHRDEKYGKVTDILPSAGHPVYIVDVGKTYEKLVPAVKEFIKKVDRKKKKIYLTEAALDVLE
jgi:16S rRNA processing protein RimM